MSNLSSREFYTGIYDADLQPAHGEARNRVGADEGKTSAHSTHLNSGTDGRNM